MCLTLYHMASLFLACFMPTCYVCLAAADYPCSTLCGFPARNDAWDARAKVALPRTAFIFPPRNQASLQCSENDRVWTQRAKGLLSSLGIKNVGKNCTSHSTWLWGRNFTKSAEDSNFLRELYTFGVLIPSSASCVETFCLIRSVSAFYFDSSNASCFV